MSKTSTGSAIRVFPATYFQTHAGFMSPTEYREITLADGSRAQLMRLEPCAPPVSNEFVAAGCELFESPTTSSRHDYRRQ